MKKAVYTTEFKEASAQLVLTQGYSIREACEAVGVSRSAMRSWVQQLTAERQGITPKSAAISAEHQKIQELESKIKRIEREKEILKNSPCASAAHRIETPHPVHFYTVRTMAVSLLVM